MNDYVTKSKFDNVYGLMHSLPGGTIRATDVMIAGKKVLDSGYGDVGKGCAQSMRAQRATMMVTEVDPTFSLKASMEGILVVTVDDIVGKIDILVTATNNANIGNPGHFDDEIEMEGLQNYKWVSRSPAICFPTANRSSFWLRVAC